MSIHNQHRRDKQTAWLAVTAGVEIECAHFDPKGAEWIANMTKLTKPVRKLVEVGMLKPEQDRGYAVQCFVDTVVKGWRTVNDKGEVTHDGAIEITDGDFVKYSREAAVKVFMDYPTFYNDVVDVARDLGSFQLTEAERKNSGNA